ncbi:hypothetical protein M9Y10_001032 [Tritrichomonas musculus]|uniref:Uncharacterized protein n=1 Tax=Tritrichomonas musculus TaxID=1915356 RepID=A0ABR2L5V4_9EUKA
MNEKDTNKIDCNCAYEYKISPRNGTIKGCLLANLFNYNQNKISLLCSSSILIKSVTINQQKAFFSRSSTQDEYGNLHIYFPSKKESPFWTPIPNLTPTNICRKNYMIVIIFEIKKKNPSIIIYNNFICTTNFPFGIAGWMPVFCDMRLTSIEKLILNADREGYYIIGPGKPIMSTPTRKEYNLTTIYNLDLLAWAVGEINKVKIHGYNFYSIDQFDPSNFSFLDDINKVQVKAQHTHHPFLILPNHFTQLEITTGFFILSASLLEDYFNFPSIIPIPSSYHLVAAVSYGLSFDIYCRRFNPSFEMNWFLSGLISYTSRVFLKSGIGSQGMALYDFILIQYLRNFENEKLDFFSSNANVVLSMNRWEINSPLRIKAMFVIHIIAGLLADSFRKPRNFPNAWPNDLNKQSFTENLSKLTNNDKTFQKVWIKGNIIPIVEIQINVNLNKELRSLMSCQVSYQTTNIKKSNTKIPGSFVAFHSLGKVSQNVLLDVNGKSECVNFTDLPKNRPLKSIKMKSFDGIYWISFEMKPRIPIVIHYQCPNEMLFNIIMNYDSSLITQHDALVSLNRILLTTRDTGDMEIIQFLSNLLTDNKSRTFFSLKCHALVILGNVSLATDVDGDQANAARKEIINYFLDYIANRETTYLQKLDLIHPLLVLTAFRVISKLITVTEKYTSFDFLKTALVQLSSNVIGPGIVYCFRLLIKNSNEKQITSLIPHLIGFISNCSGNLPLMTAAIRVYSIILRWYEKMVAEKILISMIESFDDHQLPLEARAAIADLLFENYYVETFVAIMIQIIKGISKEFESVENSSFIFIGRMMKLLNSKCLLLTEPMVSEIKESCNLYEIYKVIHMIACHSSDSYISLFSDTKAVFQKVFSHKWNKILYPDGIIKTSPVDLNNETIADGLFSDDE